MTVQQASGRRQARVIGLISLAHGTSHFYQLALPPLFPHLKEAFAVGYTELGTLMTVFYISSGVSQTAAGFLVDRFSARAVLLCGLALLCTATVLMGLAPSFWALFPLAVLAGLGNSVFHPSDLSILTASVRRARHGRAYGFHTLGRTFGANILIKRCFFPPDPAGGRGIGPRFRPGCNGMQEETDGDATTRRTPCRQVQAAQVRLRHPRPRPQGLRCQNPALGRQTVLHP